MIDPQTFVPHPWLQNAHVMTVVSRYWPRRALLAGVPTEARLFTVSPDTKVLGWCHWHADVRRHPTLILLHGLEGCADSQYMLGLAGKAWRAGCNVLRLNQRNCGGTEHLTPTLYNGGLTGDVEAVLKELSSQDGLEELWAGGYSMGGNLALLLAGQWVKSLSHGKNGPARRGHPPGGYPGWAGAIQPQGGRVPWEKRASWRARSGRVQPGSASRLLKGVVAVCPDIDPEACVTALEQRGNWIYQEHFVNSMKSRLRRKAKLFPGKFDLSRLPSIRTLRAFDGAFTAPDGGYHSAEDYYERTGARHVLAEIDVPTLIVTSKDDPFIPYRSFENPALRGNSHITLVAVDRGGHCGFVQHTRPGEDHYWAENRLIEFVLQHVPR